MTIHLSMMFYYANTMRRDELGFYLGAELARLN